MMTYRCYTNSMLERISIIICKMSKRLEIVRYPINKKTPEFVEYEFFFSNINFDFIILLLNINILSCLLLCYQDQKEHLKYEENKEEKY